MADKSRCGPELTELEIDALVDDTTPGNTQKSLEFLMKQLFCSGNSFIVRCNVTSK